MRKPIRDQVIVITGASSGIGLVTVREAARRGAKVVLAARNEQDLEQAIAGIRAVGGDAIAVPADVTDPAQMEHLARRAAEEYGRIDTWINNAGVSVYGTFDQVPLDEFRRVVDVIFFGCVHGARAALPHLEKTGGTLICLGSALSDRGVPLQGAYCAAKHALNGWLDALRVELMKRRSRVHVTLVKPSSMDTPLFAKAKTYLGVEPQPIPPAYAPEVAAEAILRAAETRPRDVFVGGWGNVLSVAQRISPRLVDLYLERTAFQAQRTDRPKGADAPSNLFAPVAHDGGARGAFAEREKRRSYYQWAVGHPAATSLPAAAALGLGAIALARSSRDAKPAAALLGAAAMLLAGRGMLAVARGAR
ncbi:MAG TPA: SDR family oxidoreductase [Longimicrobiales bacterium]